MAEQLEEFFPLSGVWMKQFPVIEKTLASRESSHLFIGNVRRGIEYFSDVKLFSRRRFCCKFQLPLPTEKICHLIVCNELVFIYYIVA